MSMSKKDLPAEGQESPNGIAHRTPSNHGMGLDEAIHEFIKLEVRRGELAQERAAVMEILLSEAYGTRGTKNTARLASHDGKQLKVEFKVAYKCDVDLLNTAKDLIGDDRFEALFKTEYSPRLRELDTFLATKSTDERIEQAKETIKQGLTKVERSPYVSIEKV